MKRRGKRASVWWELFTEDEGHPGRAKCSLCPSSISTQNGNTTNMKNHLQSKHVVHYLALKKKKDGSAVDDGSPNPSGGELNEDVDDEGLLPENPVSPVSSSSSLLGSPPPTPPPGATAPTQPARASFSTSRASPFSPPPSPAPHPSAGRRSVSPAGSSLQTNLESYRIPDSKTTERLHMAVTHYIVTCNRPLNTVEKSGFKRMLQAFKPGYTVLSRKSLTYTYIPKLVAEVKVVIKSLIKDAGPYALTSDNWTSEAGVPFTSLTAHFIDTSWNLQAVTLSCRATHLAHTGLNLKEFFLDELRNWELAVKDVSAAVTDNASEMRVATEALDLDHMRCLGHTIQNGVNDMFEIECIQTANRACRRLLQWISTNKVKTAYKAFVRQRYNQDALAFPSTSPTRWWTDLKLFEHVVKSADVVREFAASHERGRHLDKVLSPENLYTVRSVIRVLKPLEEICTKLSADTYVTIAAVLPVLHLLEAGFEDDDDELEVHNEADELEIALNKDILKPASLRKYITFKLKKRYSPEPLSEEDLTPQMQAQARIDIRCGERCRRLLVKCSFLDPRYKEELSAEEQKLAMELLVEDFAASCQDEGGGGDGSTGAESTVAAAPVKTLSTLFAKKRRVGGDDDNAGEGRAGSSRTPTAKEAFREELVRFSDVPAVAFEVAVGPWWRDRRDTYPRLEKLARKFLAIPATSTTSERLFSLGGQIVIDTRCCLSDEHTEDLIFLSSNATFL